MLKKMFYHIEHLKLWQNNLKLYKIEKNLFRDIVLDIYNNKFHTELIIT